MRTVSIVSNPPPVFEALSYVWGRDDPRELVRIAGVHIAVRDNLAGALRHLRYTNKPRTLWTDALCINQDDLAERSSQVALMGDIYRSATRVVVWLGVESEDSNGAMNLMDKLGSMVTFDFVTREITPTELGKSDPEWAHGKLPFSMSELSSIYNLVSREWFERIWVRQEISLANDEAVIMCGAGVTT